MLAGAVWAAATREDVPVIWLGFLVESFLFMEVWLARVVICGPVLYRRGPFRWSEPLRAAEVEEVTLHYNPGRFDWFRRDLTIITRGRQAGMFSARWWPMAPLVAWLVRHCTRMEEGQLVWAVKTDEKTRSRLEPYARQASR